MPHLVLVDDDDLFREALGLNLIDEGYQVTSFSNGRDALAYLEGGDAADVVLLDWRMPNLTGLEVLRRLRNAKITTPVIFLTVLSDDIYEEAALDSGAVGAGRERRRRGPDPGAGRRGLGGSPAARRGARGPRRWRVFVPR